MKAVPKEPVPPVIKIFLSLSMEILIDTVYINSGGGKVLLDYLIKEICLKPDYLKKTFFLIDQRYKSKHLHKLKHLKIKNNSWGRFLYYAKNKNKFDKIFTFGNIPPTHKQRGFVINYFHQTLFVDDIKNKDFKVTLKKLFINLLKNNVNLWVAQNKLMSDKIKKKYGHNLKTDIIPFYQESRSKETIKEFTFFYPSLGYEHKNHVKLISAFIKFYKVYNTGKLILTVGDENRKLKKELTEIQKKYPVINLGYINKNEVNEIYKTSEFVIFPSLNESFGLGLIEAINFNCKVLVSDLDYATEICIPSLSFDPNSEDDLINAFIAAKRLDLPYPKPLIKNDIKKLLSQIYNEN